MSESGLFPVPPKRKERTIPPNRLAELRTAAGLKLYDLAYRYRIDPSTVWRWEMSLVAIPDDLKPIIAKDLGVTVAYLMCDWDTPDAESVQAMAS